MMSITCFHKVPQRRSDLTKAIERHNSQQSGAELGSQCHCSENCHPEIKGEGKALEIKWSGGIVIHLLNIIAILLQMYALQRCITGARRLVAVDLTRKIR